MQSTAGNNDVRLVVISNAIDGTFSYAKQAIGFSELEAWFRITNPKSFFRRRSGMHLSSVRVR